MARRRKRIMGIPVGRSGPSNLARAARVGAMGATALAAVPAAQRGLRMAGRAQELAGQAGDVIGAAGQVKEAVSSHSSTVGKAVGVIGVARHLGQDGSDSTPKLSHLIEENTEISVPRAVAYNQWTQMEMFPSLVKGVNLVDQLGDDRTEWISKIGPVRRRWKARIVEQVPDERIAWKSESGPEHRGAVTFHSLDDELTRVLVQMHYVPHGPLETVANKLRIQRRRVRRDLRLFKHFLEMQGEETGAWRGRIGEDSADRRDPHSANGRSRSAEASGRGGQSRSRSESSRPQTQSRTQSKGRTQSNGRAQSNGGSQSRSRSQSKTGSRTGRSKEMAR